MSLSTLRRRAATVLWTHATCQHTLHTSSPSLGRRALKNRDKKLKTSLAKSQLYGRVGAAVRAAVRSGGPDPATNTALRDAAAAAKAAAVPLSIVQRNVDRGAAMAGGDDVTVGVVASGLPGGGSPSVALLVQANTDSVARLTADVRAVTNKAKSTGARVVASGGGGGAAAGLGFQRVAAVVVEGPLSPDAVIAAAADAGADDITPHADRANAWRVTGPPEAYGALRDALAALSPDASVALSESGLEFVATSPVVGLETEARAALDSLVDSLLAVDGVDAVWSAADDEEEEEGG